MMRRKFLPYIAVIAGDYAYPYQFRNGTYPGPYGVYPFNPLPYYSDFRLNSLAGMQWEPFQKNWSATMDYAKTESSFKVYSRPTATYPAVQFLPSITGDTPVIIVYRGMQGSGISGWKLHRN
jgi:hypothetical protein